MNFILRTSFLKVEGEFSESEFVRSTVGVGNVCERSAMYCAAVYKAALHNSSINSGGRLIIKKTARDGVTVAAAVRD